MPSELLDTEKINGKLRNGHHITTNEEKRREQHSEKVNEIVSHRPGFLVRWGNVFLFSVLILLLTVCWFIRYPDIVYATAKLTSIRSPKEVIALTEGKLIKLNIREGEFVKKGSIIGYVESTANHNAVLKLSADLDSVELYLRNNNVSKLRTYVQYEYVQLGELQPQYQEYERSFLVFRNYWSDGMFARKREMLIADIANLEKMHTNLLEQKTLQEQNLKIAQKDFDVNKSLKDDNVISDLDLRVEESKLIGKKLTVPQVNHSIILNESQQNEKHKEVMELENTISQQVSIFRQVLQTFRSHVDDWKKKYLLISPIDGNVAFASTFQENQQLKTYEVICFIHPQDTEYFAEIVIPQANFGKVDVGQPVLLKFSSYPFQEFGSVKGRIEFVSQIPTDSGYFAKILLTDGLATTNKKKILYREGLLANAEILTKDLRLLERFYYDIIKMLKR
jgi:multidrug efflux pump subunit AcrA (membrane-fusion protein)